MIYITKPTRKDTFVTITHFFLASTKHRKIEFHMYVIISRILINVNAQNQHKKL